MTVQSDAAETLWLNEGGPDISSLVDILSNGTPYLIGSDLSNLVQVARELAVPVYDAETVAEADGWSYESTLMSAERYCIDNELAAIERKINAHMAVSEWLADRLAGEGEKVVKSLGGLSVWAKTTEGPVLEHPAILSIAADYEPDRKASSSQPGM